MAYIGVFCMQFFRINLMYTRRHRLAIFIYFSVIFPSHSHCVTSAMRFVQLTTQQFASFYFGYHFAAYFYFPSHFLNTIR